jgi:predicted transcriptional regulator
MTPEENREESASRLPDGRSNYTQTRSELAKRMGLDQRKTPVEVAPQYGAGH